MPKFSSYKYRFNRDCDFIVEYEFISDQEGYVKTLSQGMRSDFCYEGQAGKLNHMIWPEFDDLKGSFIDDTEAPISNIGRAKMWIVLEEEIQSHKGRLRVGQKAYFVDGTHKIANLKVIEIAEHLKQE